MVEGLKLRVVGRHRSDYPEPIGFSEGERVEVGRRDDEFPGWVRAVTGDGNEGWAPEGFLRMGEGGSAVAMRGYSARELDVEVGEALEGVEVLNGWVWCRRANGDEGWVPEGCVEAFDG